MASTPSPSSSTLITGFTAFSQFAVNPSALLAEGSGRPFVLLEVAYAAVDLFVSTLELNTIDRVVLMGVAGTSSTFRLETLAQNRIDRAADVRGHVPPSDFIDANAPIALLGTLWPAHWLASPPAHAVISDDAGGYLCNYLYFRMLLRFPNTSIGFLHVPPTDKMPIAEQHAVLKQLLDGLEAV